MNANCEVWLHHLIITSMEGCVSSFTAPPQPLAALDRASELVQVLTSTWCWKLSSSYIVTAHDALFLLSKHGFPPAKWENLATALKLAVTILNIKANTANVDSRLQDLVFHWLANDSEATWQKLVEAVRMSNEEVIAMKLAQDIGASSASGATTPPCESVYN